MNSFMKFLAKYTLITSIIVVILLLTAAGLLIFAPMVFLNIVRWGLAALCIALAIHWILALIRSR